MPASLPRDTSVALTTGLLSVLLATATMLPAQDPPRTDPRLGPAAKAEADARRARILAEVASLGADTGWAGSYYRGDGLGVNVCVDLAPKSGFVFTWSGCLGVYDRNYGTFTEKNGRLEFTFTFPNVRRSFRGLGPVLVPVRWGERRYLIASEELPGFANAVNGGSEPRDRPHGHVLLRRGDEKRPVKGKPELPAEIAGLLLDEPIEGTIVAIHESRIEKGDPIGYRVSEATIDRGEHHGLRKGHIVHFLESAGGFAGRGRVIEFGDKTARIRIRGMHLEEIPVPEAGWKWSTRSKHRR